MRRRWAHAITFACAAGLALLDVGCGAQAPPRAVETRYTEPRWQDVFDTMPDMFAVVRPRALRQDTMYGALLRRALELARQQSRVVAATRALEAVEDADELVVGVRPASLHIPEELVLVARGVRADLDPGSIVDESGHLLWAPGPAGAVRELERERDENGTALGASLFELPGRTWVVASGGARTRAREVFAHPTNRPAIDIEPDALAVLWLAGPPLVERVRPLSGTGRLAAVGRHLQAATLVLPPGQDRSIRATFLYADEDSAAFAEVALREAIDAVSRSQRQEYVWLGAAKVERPDKRVVVTTPLPQGLVEALVRAAPP